jgi:hypothetical protein
VDKHIYARTLRRFQAIPLNQFDEFYNEEGTDQATVCVSVDTPSGQRCICSYGTAEPPEVTIFLGDVMTLYQHAELSMVDSVVPEDERWSQRGDYCGMLDPYFLGEIE